MNTMISKPDKFQLNSDFLFKNNPLPMWIYDLQTLDFIEVNRAAVKMYGYSRKKFLSMTLKDISSKEDVSKLLKNVSKLQSSVTQTANLRHKLKSDKTIHVVISSHKIKYSGRKAVIETCRDVTDQKIAEENLKLAQFGIDDSKIAIFQIGDNGKINYANNQACKNLGYTYEELTSLRIVDIDQKFKSAKWKEHGKHIYKSGSGITETIHRRKDGRELFVEVSTNIIEYEGKKRSFSFVKDITRRRRFIEALRESEQRFQVLAENSPVGIFQTDAKGSTLYVNQRWCQISGLSSKEAMGNGWLDAVHPDDKEKLSRGWKKATNIHRPSHAEYRFVHGNGTITWVIGEAIPEKDSKNKIIGYIGTITDITERKKAEQKIQESEKRLAKLIEGTKALLFSTDHRGRFIYCNNAGCELLGLVPDQLLGSFYLRLVHPDDRKRVHEQYLLQLKQGLEDSYLEFRYIRKNSKVGWLSFSVNPIIQDGKIIGLTGVAQDITERKRAEVELQESGKKFRSVIEEAVEIVFTADNSGYFTYVNAAGIKASGYSLEELTKIRYIDLIEPEFKLKVNLNYYRQFKERRALTTTEYPFRTKSGQIKWFNQNTRLIVENDAVKGFYVIARDVTERRKAQEALQESENKLDVIIESTADGVLAVDNNGKVIKTNNRFAELWRIPKSLLDSGDDSRLINFVLDQLVNPEHFLNKVSLLYNSTDIDTDMLYFKDGRTFERYSAPLLKKNKVLGRVWSFHDITARNQAEEQIKNRLEIEKLVSDISSKFINLPSNLLNSAITEALGMIGKFASVDRSYLFLFSEDGSLMDNTHEWCAEGIEPQIDNLKELPVSMLPWWMSKLNNFETIYIPIVSELPIEANAEKEILESQDIKSVIVIPIKSGNILFGFLGFDSVSYEKVWAEEDILLLKTLSEIFISALNRGKYETALKDNEQKLRNILEHSTNIFFSHDNNHVLTYMSPKIQDLLGFTVEEVMRKWTDLSSDNSINEIGFQKTVKAIESGVAQEPYELELIHKNGSKVWVEVREAPVVENGKTIAIVGSISDISKRKLVEETLRNSEKRYHDLFKYAPVGIYQSTRDDRFVNVNSRLVEILGYDTPEELLNLSISKDVYYDPKEREVLIAEFEPVGSVFNYDIRWKKKNGDHIWISLTSHAVKDESDDTIYFEGFVRDITERKQVEETLRVSEEKFRSLVESINEVFYIADNKGKVTYCSPNITVTTGFLLQEIVGNSYLRLVAPIDRRFVMDHYIGFSTKAVSDTILEFRVRDKDGNIIWVEQITHIVRDKSGEVVEYRNVTRDLTDRKKAEEELKKLSMAVEQSPVSVVITNKDGDIEFVNQKFYEVTGYSKADAIGKNPRILKSGHHDQLFYKDLWDQIISGKEWEGEIHNKRKNGELYWESVLISPLLNNAGDITHFVALKEDITAKKIMMEELIRAKDTAESSNKLKDAFIANMSHEIRTPLNGILGLSSILEEFYAELIKEEDRIIFDGIKRSSNRLIRTVDMILNYSRLQTGQFPVKPEKIELSSICENLVNEFTNAAKNKRLKLLFKNRCDNSTTIFADEFSITQAISNLIDNAIKYTNEGFIDVILYNGSEGEILLNIEDSGIGISENYQNHIFEPYRQEQMGYGRAYEGVGLGLSMVNKFLNLNNANIVLESKKGKGSKFTVNFGMPIQSLPDKIIENRIYKVLSPQSISKKPLVLLVEDDVFNQATIKLFLKNKYDTIVTDSSNDAIELLQNNEVDIVLMDVSIKGGKNGLELTKEFKSSNEFSRIPIIAITAHAFESDRQTALEAGCDDYLSKPFSKDLLLETIGKFF